MEVIMLCILTLAVMDGYDFWCNVILHAMAYHKEWAMSQEQELYWEWKLSQGFLFFPVNQILERYFEISLSEPDIYSEDERLERKKCTEFSNVVYLQIGGIMI